MSASLCNSFKNSLLYILMKKVEINELQLYYSRALLYCQVKNRVLCYIFYMITIKNIQVKLREAIKNCPLTQKQIAEELHLHPTSINKYMCEDIYPSLETFANLCKILDVSADDILGLND